MSERLDNYCCSHCWHDAAIKYLSSVDECEVIFSYKCYISFTSYPSVDQIDLFTNTILWCMHDNFFSNRKTYNSGCSKTSFNLYIFFELDLLDWYFTTIFLFFFSF